MSKDVGSPSRLGGLRGSMRSSLRALLGRHDDAATQFNGADEETIRGALLALLPAADARPSLGLMTLRRRIQYAPDCDSLWYLRADMLPVLATNCGEGRARQQLAALDHLFPRGLRR
jgi:hypothetical protein